MTPEKLRASILQYAIQGKLVEQRAEDGTADSLYQQIQEKKQELIKEGKIKKEKPLLEITDDEIPFDIPEGWMWTRLGEISWYFDAGKSPNCEKRPANNDEWGVITTTAVQLGFFDEVQNKVLPKSFDVNKEIQVRNNDILITRAGPMNRTGIACLVKNISYNLILSDKTIRLNMTDDNIDKSYIVMVLNSPQIRQLIIDRMSGMDKQQVNVSQEKYKTVLIPLPPLAEQKRIVAKIEELLPIVDRYAVAYEKLEKFNAKFPKDMKNSILQYAIQGKLVEQRVEEGTGEELYQKIQLEKQNLIDNGKIKKEKPLPEISDDEIPFDIPETWKWVRLGDCTGYAQTKEKISPSDIADDMWSLDLEDIEKDTGEILVQTRASERKITGEKVVFHKGQVLYSKLRPYLKKILVAPDDGICTPELVPFDTYLIDENYIAYVLRSPHVDNVINSVTYGVKMPRVGTDTMVNLLIPLPPLAEQKRIVAKIEELLPYCDKLVKEMEESK